MMEMTLSNKAMQPMSGFGLQLNKNSFGLVPAEALNVPNIASNQSFDVSLPLGTNGPVQRMDPLTNLQVYRHASKMYLAVMQSILIGYIGKSQLGIQKSVLERNRLLTV